LSEVFLESADSRKTFQLGSDLAVGEKMKNVIAARPGSYGKYAALAFQYLPKAGIFNVEIGPPAPDEIPELEADLAKFGLEVTSLATGCDLSKADQVDSLLQTMETARRMDVGIIFCSTRSGDLPLEEAYRKLSDLGDEARKHGAVISMETHPNLCQNGEQMLQTMEAVKNEAIRINFDTANIYYYNEGVDAVTELKKVSRYVASVHLKDTNGGYKTHYFPALGQGVVDYPEVFRILNDLGFHGPFTLEMEGIAGEELTLEETHQRVVDSMAYLRSIGVI